MLRKVIPGHLWGTCPFDEALVFEHSRKRRLLPENPAAIISVLFPYYMGEWPRRNVARYACVSDYHKVAGEILANLTAGLETEYPGETFARFIDDSPIREVAAASACGLGAVGRHGMLIHEVYGSWVFIGTIVTTLKIPCETAEPKSCLSCCRCVAACPTGALTMAGDFKKNRCRSYLTQKKGILEDWERSEIKAGGMAWGCDICADACPLNKDTPVTGIGGFLRDAAPVLSRENMDIQMSEKSYGWRGRDVLSRNLSILGE